MLSAVLKAIPSVTVAPAARQRRYCRVLQGQLSQSVSESLRVFDALLERQSARQAARAARARSLRVTLPDGVTLEGKAGVTRPLDIARQARCETDPPIVARVSGQLWDLERPLEADCDLQFLGFSSTEGKEVFWRSSASVLGGVLISEWGGSLCRLGSTESGFYSDVHLDQRSLSGSDLSSIEKGCRRIVSQKVPFIRLEVSQDELRELFKHNKFVMETIETQASGPTATVYRCGSLVTLCSGPHITNTSRLKVLQLLQVSFTTTLSLPLSQPLFLFLSQCSVNVLECPVSVSVLTPLSLSAVLMYWSVQSVCLY
ncbi:SYTM protein, partial [Atractosteus spatula]|nr:SYTM protein [Atractosteus spatula]